MLMPDNVAIPHLLQALAQPPERLFVMGDLPALLERPRVAIVGSRKVSPYGRAITEQLAGELAEQGIIIVSGLAFGVDSIAHRAALEAGGTTIAVLPSPLNRIYPSSHHQLAQQIVQQGGALVSEYPSGTPTMKHHFIARNRLIAGLSDAVVVTEAALKSGSLHTARFALESGRDVLAVPGAITSPTSEGTNNLLKAGAAVVTSAADVLHTLGIEEVKSPSLRQGSNPDEQQILDLIDQGITDGAALQAASGLPAETFSQTLTMLEITGKIRSLGANRWSR